MKLTLQKIIFLGGFLPFIFSSCTPVTIPTIQATVCAGESCLPPTLTPIVTPAPTPTPIISLGETRQIASGKVISFWHSYPLSSSGVINILIDDFNANNPDAIKVVQRAFFTDDQLELALSDTNSAVDRPDVVMGETDLLFAMDAQKPLPDLVGYLSDPIIGLSGDQQKGIKVEYWDNLTRNGRLVGIPTQRDATILLYNQSWAESLGFNSPPVTFDDFIAQTKAAFDANIYHQEKTMRGTGGWLIDFHPETALAFMGTNFEFNDQENVFSEPAILEMFTKLKEQENLGYAWLGKNGDPVPYFVNRQALFVSALSSELPEMIIHMKALKMTDEWTIIPYPQISDSGNEVSKGYSFGLTAETKEQQMAGWLFIQWMLKPERQAYIGANQFTIPMDQIASDQLADFGYEPELLEALRIMTQNSEDIPVSSNWILASVILDDGFRQLFQPETTLEMIPAIVDEMNKTYSEYRK
jgi:ABC-type glycerol-3-phosphate transport system substrate-binding protein